jgi:hypothetical protein
MLNLSKETVSKLATHFAATLKSHQLSDVKLTGFTLQPQGTAAATCAAGSHEEWVPVGPGKFELQCVPDIVPGGN